MSAATRNNLHFVVAAVVLAGSAQFLAKAKENRWLSIIKKPLPLRRSLEEFNRTALSPWQLVSASRLPAESEEELGTKEYLNWTLIDPTKPGLRRKAVSFTVTYYTGVQDQVPHVSEECLYQSGMSQSAPKEIMKLDLPRLGESAEVAKVMFDSPRQLGERLYVYYTIAVNGEFKGDRNGVRLRMNNWRDTHLYYSKVEVSIHGRTDADPREIDGIGRDLMDRALAELVRTHWPLRGEERGGPGTDMKKSA